MKRAILVSFVMIWLGIANSFAAGAQPTTRPTRETYLRLADEMETNLQREILDKFFPVTIDERGGGFFENYGPDWKRTSGGEKSIVYQSRLTWTSAKAARRFPAKADLYVAMTRRGTACLMEKMWDKQGGGFFWTVDAFGQPTSGVKQMYGHAFGIYALAASYEATNDPAALELEKKAFAWLEQHAHDKDKLGYFENIGLDGRPVTSGRGNPLGAAGRQKSMNTSIHILEALAELYRIWPDPLLKTRLQEMLDICRDKIYSEPGYLTQFFSTDWQRTSCPDSFGHDVEAGYLMIEAAEALGQADNLRNWAIARRLLDHALQYGWDEHRGGLYESGTINAQGEVTGGLRTEKYWWLQAEHLNALLLQHHRAGKQTDKYWNAFIKQWDWISKSQIDHKYGGWLPMVSADGTPGMLDKADLWTECYHQGRAMLNVSQRLRQMADEK